jgi:hypothetical protein
VKLKSEKGNEASLQDSAEMAGVLTAVEHQTMIEPASETLHHETVSEF